MVVTAADAVTLLRADHKHVSDLFSQFEKARASKRKAKQVEEICRDLTVHAQVEEEIFCPAFRVATRDKELVPEATVEHQTMKNLIAQVQGVPPDDEIFDAKVKEEQGEMFPKAKSSKMPMAELGEQSRQRKAELLAGYS